MLGIDLFKIHNYEGPNFIIQIILDIIIERGFRWQQNNLWLQQELATI